TLHELRNGIRLISAIFFFSILLPYTSTRPLLTNRIFSLIKQNKYSLFSTRDENSYRFRLSKSCQIIKIAVLSIRIMNISITKSFRSSSDYHDTVARQHGHELLTSFLVNCFHENSIKYFKRFSVCCGKA